MGIFQIQSTPSPPSQELSERARKNHPNMASARSSSSCPQGPKQGGWENCSISHGQLVKLQTQGFLPPTDLVPIRAGLASFDGGEQVEKFCNPSRGNEYVLFPTY